MRISLIMLLLFTMFGCGSGAPDTATVKEHMASAQLALSDPVVNSVGMVLVPIPDGEFRMGSPRPKPDKSGKKKQDVDKTETPQHRVKITKPFFIGVCEVTQQQYEAVMSAKPWTGKPLVETGPNYAATYITWDDAVEFCKKLSDLENAEYRLPTEAEWEYACRAGTTTAFSFGDEWGELQKHAWVDQNAYKAGEQYAHGVGQKLPNPWGLYDTHGNAWEWCQDWYARYDGKKKEIVDPAGPKKGRHRVWRGGGFADSAVNARSATRLSYSRPDYRPEFMTGFRVVRNFNQAR